MIFRIFLLLTLFIASSCSIFQWEGHYVNTNSEEYKNNKDMFPYRGQNGELIRSKNIGNSKISAKINISFPSKCSVFGITGIFTPLTPPVPIFWLRRWASELSECGNFYMGLDNFS